MPFAVADRPSIQCGLLAAVLQSAGHDAAVRYVNVELAAALGGDRYHVLAAPRRNQQLLGEWLYSFAAFGERGEPEAYRWECGLDESCEEMGWTYEELTELREQTLPALLDGWAADDYWDGADVVGFTSTFEQNVAALALGRRLKERYPHLVTVYGGANFDGVMGAEYARAFPWIDYAVIGEGEIALCHLLDSLGRGGQGDGIPGVVRQGHPSAEATRATSVEAMDDLPPPDYRDYFTAIFRPEHSGATTDLPLLLVETARGCWWGQKHHCTFCGLNNSSLTFRSKTPEVVLRDLRELSKRYSILNFEAVDNIMDMRYLPRMWAALANEPFDYRFFYEVKANLTREQLRTLFAAGVSSIQPGIESLSTHVLKLMRKGTTVLHNVRVLKWAHYYGMSVGWNVLLGFPGERPEDYARQAALIPLLHHLPPPSGAGPVWMERFSPMFFDASFPVRAKAPEPAYRHIYPNAVDVSKTAYFFQYEMDGVVDEAVTQPVVDAVDRWRAAWEQSPSLVYQRAPDWMQILDRRDPENPGIVALHDEDAAICEAIGDRERTAAAVAEALSLSADLVEGVLERLCGQGLAIEDEGRYLGLAMPTRFQ
jgi:ribosomal peptide maturation radical SAM protein 1